MAGRLMFTAFTEGRVRNLEDYYGDLTTGPAIIVAESCQTIRKIISQFAPLSVSRWEITFSWLCIWLLCCNNWHFIPIMFCQTWLQQWNCWTYKTLLFAVCVSSQQHLKEMDAKTIKWWIVSYDDLRSNFLFYSEVAILFTVMSCREKPFSLIK